VTVQTIIDHIVNISIPWDGSVFLLDHKGTIMAMSTKGEQLLGLKELTDKHYDEIIKQDTFKPEQYNISTHSVFNDIAPRLFETAHAVSPALSPNETQTPEWATIGQTGWKLLFLISLYYRTRKTSLAIADHINGIDTFQVLFQKSSDGVLLIEGKQFVDCNEAIVSMLKYENKEGLLQAHPSELSPELQPDGQSSYAKAEEMIMICLEKGYNRYIVKEMLRSWNFPVSEAASGEEGLREILRAHKHGTPYRLLILDQKMNSMTGLELVDRLTDELDSGIAPFLLLSSSSDHDVAKQCRAIEDCTLLLKPVRRSDLFDAISFLPAAVDSSGTPEIIDLKKIQGNQTGRNLEILLVEDNEANRDLATILLGRDGHKVIAAVNGVEALQLLNRQHFDIIFMDVQMPEMDGLMSTRLIRGCENGSSPQHPEYASLLLSLADRLKGQHIPIVAMTGDRQECFEAGADDYLTKPFLPDAIEAVLLKYSELT